MKFHGIEIQDLSKSEIEAGSAAMDLLHHLKADLYTSNFAAWKVLAHAQTYLADFIRPRLNGRMPRTFNRDLVYPVKKDADGNRLCRWDQKPVPRKRMSYCSEQCRIEVDIRTSAGSLRYYVKQRDKGICADCGCDTQKLERVLDHAARAFYQLLNGDSTGTWYRGDFTRHETSLLLRLTKERREAKVRLQSAIDQWMNETQDNDVPFDCWIGEETVTLMTDAAFAVIEAVEDLHVYLKREGMLKDAAE